MSRDFSATDLIQHMNALLGSNVGQAWAEASAALEQFQAQGNAAGEQQALYYMGLAKFHQGHLDESARLLTQALELAQELGDLVQANRATARLARVLIEQGQLDGAEELLSRLLEQSLDPELLALSLSVRGALHHTRGDSLAALADLYEILRLRRTQGDLAEIALALDHLGVVEMELCDFATALKHFEEARTLLQSLPQRQLVQEIRCSNNIAGVHYSVQDYEQALSAYREVLELSKECGYFLGEITGATNVIDCLITLGRLPEASATLGDYLALARAKGMTAHESHLLMNSGHLALSQRDYEQAAEHFAGALRLFQKTGNLEYIFTAQLALIEAQMALGRAEDAEPQLTALIESARAARRSSAVMQGYKLLAQWYAQRGQFEQAYHCHQQFQALNSEIFSEESTRQMQQLTAKLSLERAQHQAEKYRLQHAAAEEARALAEALVRERTRELEQAQMEVVSRLALASDYRDDLTGEHTRRVGYYVAAIGLQMGLPADEVYLLMHAARLHDLGKIGIPDAILLKPGGLTEAEFEKIKEHTLIGERILSTGQSRLMQVARDIAVSHHERWDGGGYPYGLCGEEIPLMGRIVSVADVFDALTHARPYKAAWSLEESLAELEKLSGQRLDPQVTQAALGVFRRLHSTDSRTLVEQLGLRDFLAQWGLA